MELDLTKEVILQQYSQAQNLTELLEIKNKLFKQYLIPAQKNLASLKTAQEKKEMGQAINATKNLLNDLFMQKQGELSHQKNDEFLLHDDPINHLSIGQKHILEQTNDEILSIFKSLGFDILCGDDAVATFWNFDALNIGLNHPARADHDSFFINAERILKTHNTSYSAYYLHKQWLKDDIRICSYGPIFRKDDDDATHSHQFMQVDLIWVKEGLNITHLKWIVNYMLQKLFGNNIQTRYRLSFFPFTEPSFEVDIDCFNCHGKGCSICKNTGWIEVLGAGVLHKNVLSNVGMDPNKYTGIAFGVGVERIAMLKHKITDIRNFYVNDFNFLKQFK